jgi:hypothetical protein
VVDALWRGLKIGDRVRVVAWPPEIPADRMHPETREFYRWLIDSGKPLTITAIDEWGMPHGEIRRTVGGLRLSEGLLLNHGGIELVATKTETTRKRRRG